MLKINSPKVNDAFADIISETEKSDTRRKKKNFAHVNAREYTSPFRGTVSAADRAALQALKTHRYPTTSATSNYTKLNSTELGFKTIKDGDKRIRDIKFPQYLTENEIRQAGIIKDLEGKEERLQYWQSAQHITDLTTRKSKGKKQKEETLPENPENNATRLHDQLEDARVLNPLFDLEQQKAESGEDAVSTAESNVVTAEIPMFTNISRFNRPEPTRTLVSTTSPAAVICMDSSNQSIINRDMMTDATDMVNRYKVLQPPIDPDLAPKVPYSDPSLAHKTTQGQNEAEQQVNPVASPENPEEIVKIDNYGHVSKAVYDTVTYDGDVLTNYLVDYAEQQDKRYSDKVKRYEDKFAIFQHKKDAVLQQMNELKADTLRKLEVIQNKLIKDIMDSNAKYAAEKGTIMKDTELEKLKKLNECKFYYQKQALIQGQINALAVERNSIYDHYAEFTTDMNNVSGELDAKLFRVSQINYQSDQIRKEIEVLQGKKTTLEGDIANYKASHENNTTTLAMLNTGEHQKTKELTNINDTITDKLALLTIVQQESKNENLRVSKLTDKIHQKQKETEERMQKEIDDNKENYENIIATNKTDLETKMRELEESHKKEVDDMNDDYNEQIAALQKKVTQHEQEKEEARAKAAKAKLSEPVEDDSLYSYETEEEIVYQ